MIKALIVVNPILGSVRAMETMCREVKDEENATQKMNFLFNKGRTLLCVELFLFISVLWRCPIILGYFGQDPYISNLAGTYLSYSAPALISFAHINFLRRYLSVKEIHYPTIIIQVFCTAIHIPMTWYFVNSQDMGVIGAGMAITISNTFCLFLMYLYAYSQDDLEDFIKFDIVSAFTEWGPYTVRMIQVGIALVIETMYLQIITLMAGMFNVTNQLAAHIALDNYSNILVMITAGMGYFASTYVTLEFKDANVVKAKMVTTVAYVYSVVLHILTAGLSYVLIAHVCRFYTTDPEVTTIFYSVFTIWAIQHIFNSILSVSFGVLRALGKTGLGSAGILTCSYVISLPLCYFLAFEKKQMIRGLWMAPLVMKFILIIYFFVLMGYDNWNKVAENERVVFDSIEDHEADKKNRKTMIIWETPV
jgi:Na+-driven multidrug efflux pump